MNGSCTRRHALKAFPEEWSKRSARICEFGAIAPKQVFMRHVEGLSNHVVSRWSYTEKKYREDNTRTTSRVVGTDGADVWKYATWVEGRAALWNLPEVFKSATTAIRSTSGTSASCRWRRCVQQMNTRECGEVSHDNRRPFTPPLDNSISFQVFDTGLAK